MNVKIRDKKCTFVYILTNSVQNNYSILKKNLEAVINYEYMVNEISYWETTITNEKIFEIYAMKKCDFLFFEYTTCSTKYKGHIIINKKDNDNSNIAVNKKYYLMTALYLYVTTQKDI